MLLVISLFLIGCDDYLSSDLNSTSDTKGKQEKTSTDKITDSWEKIIESIDPCRRLYNRESHRVVFRF